LGVTALVAPVPVAPRFVTVDLPVMIGVSLALVLMERGLGRAVAALGIVGYGAYVALGAPLAS
ncbi:MAG: sodium:calcium antiporter, partial [Rubricella sp.]